MDAILIAGPTASGKSGLATRLALAHGGVVVNADSMQVYDTLRILTARPDEEAERTVEHRLYGHVPAGTAYSTGAWYRDVEALLEDLRRKGRLPVFVGGTGLYFRALTGGLSDIPEVPQAVRDFWRGRLESEGAPALHGVLAEKDPEMARILKPGDSQRIVRALEVLDATGRSIRSFQAGGRHGASGRFLVDPDKARKIVLMPDRGTLHERIDRRFRAMVKDGASEEVERLMAERLDPALPVMKAIGVRELAAVAAGEIDAATAVERAVAATRQYAKRQSTWFRNQLDDSWRWEISADRVN